MMTMLSKEMFKEALQMVMGWWLCTFKSWLGGSRNYDNDDFDYEHANDALLGAVQGGSKNVY